jgi:hypothetical protein
MNASAVCPLQRSWTRFGRARAILLALFLACGFLVVHAPTVNAAALTTVNWSVSNNQVSATNVTYTYSFKTATAGTIKTITFAVSGAGLGGAPAIAKNYGIGAGTVSRAGQTITYTVTAAVAVSAGIPIYIEFSGLTNGSPAGAYTTSITTQTAVPATIDGPTASNAINLAASNTAVTVTIAKSATFTVDTTAFTLAMDPSLPAMAVADLATGLQSSSTGNPVIADVSAGKATSLAWPGANKFGYTVTGTGATIDAAFSGTKYAGYVSTGEQIASRTGPTGGTADTISIVNRVAIDYAAATGDYTDTITYTMTPNYT